MKKYSIYEKIAFATGLILSVTISVYLVVSGKIPIVILLAFCGLVSVASFLWSKLKVQRTRKIKN